MTASAVEPNVEIVAPETDRLLARLDLIAHAEEQAATAQEQGRIAAALDHDTLACAGVLTLAIEQLSRTHGEICERMGAAAVEEGDVLLARALENLAGSLKAASRAAAAAAIEAHEFDESIADDSA